MGRRLMIWGQWTGWAGAWCITGTHTPHKHATYAGSLVLQQVSTAESIHVGVLGCWAVVVDGACMRMHTLEEEAGGACMAMGADSALLSLTLFILFSLVSLLFLLHGHTMRTAH